MSQRIAEHYHKPESKRESVKLILAAAIRDAADDLLNEYDALPLACIRCGDDQNLVRDDAADTGAICAWCLQHCEGLNEEWGEDSAQQQLERGPR